jgi:hypothetical protein
MNFGTSRYRKEIDWMCLEKCSEGNIWIQVEMRGARRKADNKEFKMYLLFHALLGWSKVNAENRVQSRNTDEREEVLAKPCA